AVISHGFWKRRFGGDAGIVGQTIKLNGHQFTVIGIMPEGFRGTWPIGVAPELWTPMMQPQLRPGANFFNDRQEDAVNVVGRLKPGASPAQAQAEVSLVTKRLAETYPALDPDVNRSLEGSRVYPIDRLPGFATRAVQAFIALVTVIGGLILLLVCVNVAN